LSFVTPVDSAPAHNALNLRTAVFAAYTQLAAQVQADSAVTASMFSLLAFLAAAGTFLLGQAHPLGSGRFLLVAGVGLGAVVSLIGALTGRAPSTGPQPGEFYGSYGLAAEADYLAQLLADLIRFVELNARAFSARVRVSRMAILIPAAFGVAFVFVKAVGLD
jgi:hypothetical protein